MFLSLTQGTKMEDYKKRIGEFSEFVKSSFHYLEVDYKYQRSEIVINDPESSRDIKVTIQYLGKTVGVVVAWFVGEHNIVVGIYELHNGAIPEKVSFYGDSGFYRAINLNSLCKMISNGDIEPPIPELTPNLKLKEMYRRADISADILRHNMGGVIKILAERLKKYGDRILIGDISIFPKVQEFHKKIWTLDIER